MNASFRSLKGGRIDRAKPIAFTFDGIRYSGFAGDTLASALIANGVHLIGRSFKYHRPRGFLAAGADEPNALVGVGANEERYSPNLRATTVALYEGLVAASQNRWPSLAFDVGAVNDLWARFLPAGFYYKTFMWPRSFWAKVYEPKIRAAAGLGRAPTAPDADRYTQLHHHTDVLIVGAGPAGLAAALAAAESGLRVTIADEQNEFGGSLLHDLTSLIEGKTAWIWLDETVEKLRRMPQVTLLPRTTAFGYFLHNMIALAERVTDHLADPDPKLPRERLWRVRAKEVVLATGALERPLVFPENDRPGILLAEAARAYVNRWGALPGRRAVVFTACDSAYRAALDLHAAGIEIAMIVDPRPDPAGSLIDEARAAGIRLDTSSVISGTRGRRRIKIAHVSRKRADGQVSEPEPLACDFLLMSGGWTPSVHLFSQSRGKLTFDDGLQAYVPAASAEQERSAGGCRGVYDLGAVLDDGFKAGIEAAAKLGAKVSERGFAAQGSSSAAGGVLGAMPHNRNPAAARAFVDFQNDVTAKDLKLAAREGMRSIEHVKRYTTTGMATDQGKSSNMNALGIVAESLGKTLPEVGLTTFRPPYTPVTFGAFAGAARGDLFDPVRRTPIHSSAEQAGAPFENVGQWKRAFWFPREGEDMHASVDREVKTIRNAVGVFDASTLGKIEVVGPDAAAFMDLIYTNSWEKLAPGRCRYGVMLCEDGFVMDDGVVGRLAADRFHVTTTTGGAPRVLAHMEDYLQTEFPHLNVWLTSTTEQWAVIAVQGPKAREVIAPLIEGLDLTPGAFPHMSVKECRFSGVPCRLFRISFTGELGFEVNVPADYGLAAWDAVLEAGKPFGITPYGTEVMHVARAEKGYIIIGQETDGTATPDDVGLGWAVDRAKPDFVGKRALARAAMAAPDRKQLVGLLTKDPKIVLEEGAQIVAEQTLTDPVRMIGHVTSSYASPTLGRSIALAMVKAGRARLGATLFIPMPGGMIEAVVTEPIFYDKDGSRLNG